MRFLFILLFISCSYWSNAQLPDSAWIGNWHGSLEIKSPKGTVQTLGMALNISEETDTSWQWQIIYTAPDSSEDIRSYSLYFNYSLKSYVIDEHNGILLYANLFDSKIFSWFEVEGSSILFTYSLVGESIEVEVIAPWAKPLITGDVNDVPEVKSSPVFTYQKAILKKD